MNQTDYTCSVCGKSLLGLNWGVLSAQWKHFQAYFCWNHRPLKEVIREVENKYASK